MSKRFTSPKKALESEEGFPNAFTDIHNSGKRTSGFGYKFDMPRISRIDAPGALYHIIARGIERRAIFRNDRDRDDFLERLGRNLGFRGMHTSL